MQQLEDNSCQGALTYFGREVLKLLFWNVLKEQDWVKDLFCLFHIFQERKSTKIFFACLTFLERKSTKIFFACLTFLERKSDNYHIYVENKISSRVRDTIGKCSEKKILFLRRMVDRERCISIQFHMTPSEKCGMNGTGCLLAGQIR